MQANQRRKKEQQLLQRKKDSALKVQARIRGKLAREKVAVMRSTARPAPSAPFPVLGSWGKTTQDAVRNKECWKRRHTPTQDPSTNEAKNPFPFQPRSARRALLTPRVNPGSLYRCGRST